MRQITPTYFVSPQVEPADMATAAAAGITTVICNRPDVEVPPALQADAIEAAAQAAGLEFIRLPLTHHSMTPDTIAAQASHIEETPGPVLAYCASGTRCTVIWCLGQAGHIATDDILAAARAGGYDLDSLRPTLDALAAQRG